MEDLLQVMAFGVINNDIAEDALLHNILREAANRRHPRNRAQHYGKLNLDDMTLEDIKLNFRFEKYDLERLVGALHLPEQIRTVNRYIVTAIEGVCICLRRLAYPNRLSDLEPLFGLSAQYLSDIGNTVTTYIYNNYDHLLHNVQSYLWLNQNKLQDYSQAIANRNAPLQNCWGFIDGTARPICKASLQQEEYFSGHKRLHCVKYQSVMCPDGIVISMMGAYPGRSHNAGILRESNLYRQLEELYVFPNRQIFVLYGDPAYGIRELLIYLFRNRVLTEAQQDFNSRMSSVRQAVEWGFGKIVNEFAFLDFRKNQKLLLQDISKMFAVGTILTNCHTCLYDSQTSQYFNLTPPTLEQYLGNN